MTGTKSAIGIVEDDESLRAFLVRVIADSGDLDPVFACGSVAEAQTQLDTHRIDLLLVDIGLPDGSGLDVIRHVKGEGEPRVLVLSVLGDRVTVLQALKAGADGYLLKSGRPAVILNEIRQTLEGLTPLSPQIASYLIELVRPAVRTPAGDIPALSERETGILDLFARGLSYRETADILGISVNTISDHVRKIYGKLSVHSRSEAVFEAQFLGLIDASVPVKTEPTRE
jgi:DNA-binding NarL/FixJ family response regulator